MKDGSYVVIQAFMLNDLHLKGNELIVYATVYGFTQDGEHWFHGTRRSGADARRTLLATVSRRLLAKAC